MPDFDEEPLDMLEVVSSWIDRANGYDRKTKAPLPGAWKIVKYGDTYIDVLDRNSGEKYTISVTKTP